METAVIAVASGLIGVLSVVMLVSVFGVV